MYNFCNLGNKPNSIGMPSILIGLPAKLKDSRLWSFEKLFGKDDM